MNNETSLAGPSIQDPLGASPRAAGGKGSPATADHDDLDILRAIVEGTAGSTGEEFFQDLVRHLASAIGVPFAAISEFAGVNTRVRTLAFWARGRIQENFEYDLAGTPCEDVMRGRLCHHSVGVKDRFPRAKPLVQLGVESYLGAPLLDREGKVLGLLAVFDDRPMPAQPRHLYLLRIFAARVAAVLERLRAERRLSASERRYRDLYEEAPVGYLSVGVDGRILSANHRASQMVGFSAEELEGLPVADLFGDTPAGKTRDAESFRRFLAGEELSGLEVEMRRKDGRPLWISLWMRPIRGADGKVQASRSIWVDITDRVLAEAERARLQQQNLYLQDEIKAAHNFEELIGQSPALQAVLDKVRSVAPTDASVLITGETGTGKELIARAIHSASKRRDKPLIKINCAAFPPGLVESELFGHEKGAFTGAIARRSGRFELANGGTIFLDEIGEVPPETQVKLLRVLQEREFDRVGGGSPIKVDIRVLAATNRDLLQAVRDEDVPRGPLLPSQRLPHRPAAVAGAEGRYPPAGPLPRPQVRDADRQAHRRGHGADDAAADRLPLAGERPRAGKRSRTCRHPDDGHHAGYRPRPLPSVGRGARRPATTHPGVRGARPHRHRPATNRLGCRRPPGRGPDPGTAPEYPAQPDEKARHHARLPPNPVAPTTRGGAGPCRGRAAPRARTQPDNCKSRQSQRLGASPQPARGIGTRIALPHPDSQRGNLGEVPHAPAHSDCEHALGPRPSSSKASSWGPGLTK